MKIHLVENQHFKLEIVDTEELGKDIEETVTVLALEEMKLDITIDSSDDEGDL